MSCKFYTQYNPPKVGGTVYDEKECVTQPQFANDCDLNIILARLQRGDTSMLKSTGVYYDISNAPEDLQSALHVLRRGHYVWNAQGEDFHKRFGTIESFFDFIGNDANRDEAVKLGIIPSSVPSVEPTPSVEPVKE